MAVESLPHDGIEMVSMKFMRKILYVLPVVNAGIGVRDTEK